MRSTSEGGRGCLPCGRCEVIEACTVRLLRVETRVGVGTRSGTTCDCVLLTEGVDSIRRTIHLTLSLSLSQRQGVYRGAYYTRARRIGSDGGGCPRMLRRRRAWGWSHHAITIMRKLCAYVVVPTLIGRCGGTSNVSRRL